MEAIAFSTRRAFVSGLFVPSTDSVNTRLLLYERPSKNAFASGAASSIARHLASTRRNRATSREIVAAPITWPPASVIGEALKATVTLRPSRRIRSVTY